MLTSCRAPTYLQGLVSTGSHIASEGLQVSVPVPTHGGPVGGFLGAIQGPQILEALRVVAHQVFQGVGCPLGYPLRIPRLYRGPIGSGHHATLSAGGNTNRRLSNSVSSSTRQPKASTARGMVSGFPPSSRQMSQRWPSRIPPETRSLSFWRMSRTKASAFRISSDFA